MRSELKCYVSFELGLDEISIIEEALAFFHSHASGGNTGRVGHLLTTFREERDRVTTAQAMSREESSPLIPPQGPSLPPPSPLELETEEKEKTDGNG